MDKKVIAIAILVVGAAGYLGGRYLQPAKVEVKVEERVKEVEVVKHDVRTVIREIERPDGTKEKETIIEDKTEEERNRESEKETSKIVTNNKPQWKVGGQLTPKQGIAGPLYGLSVERRVLGPVFAGAFANTDKVVGLSVSVEF